MPRLSSGKAIRRHGGCPVAKAPGRLLQAHSNAVNSIRWVEGVVPQGQTSIMAAPRSASLPQVVKTDVVLHQARGVRQELRDIAEEQIQNRFLFLLVADESGFTFDP